MKNGFLILCCLLMAVYGATGAPAAQERFAKSRAAYEASDFGEAAYQLRELVGEGHFAHGALHNLGNTEWKVARPGHAILAWERARLLAPEDRNTAANLRFARHTLRIGPPELSWYEQYSARLPAAAWLIAGTMGLWGGVVLLCAPRLLRLRRADWHQGVAALLLAVFLLTLPALLGLASRSQLGVVLEDAASLRLTPTRQAETLTTLAAGEMARIEQSRGEYFYVRADGDRAGWLHRREFSTIW